MIGKEGEKVEQVLKTKPSEPVLPVGWPTSAKKEVPEEKDVTVQPVSGYPAAASPLARKIARDAGIELQTVRGSVEWGASSGKM